MFIVIILRYLNMPRVVTYLL